MSQKSRRSFTLEQKADAVRLIQQVGNLSKVARDLDLNPNVLRKWLRQSEIELIQVVLAVVGAVTQEVDRA